MTTLLCCDILYTYLHRNMHSQLKLLAIFILVVLVMYSFFTSMNLESTFVHHIANSSSVGPEGFEDRGGKVVVVNENLETLVNQMDDSLNIKKYRKEYETAVSHSNELFELLKINTLTNLGEIKNDESDKLVTVAQDLNTFHSTKEALEGCLNYLDGK